MCTNSPEYYLPLNGERSRRIWAQASDVFAGEGEWQLPPSDSDDVGADCD